MPLRANLGIVRTELNGVWGGGASPATYYFPVRLQGGSVLKVDLNGSGQLLVRNQAGTQLAIQNLPDAAPPTGDGVVRDQGGTQLPIPMVL